MFLDLESNQPLFEIICYLLGCGCTIAKCRKTRLQLIMTAVRFGLCPLELVGLDVVLETTVYAVHLLLDTNTC